MGATLQGSQRREVSRQLGMEELEDPPWVVTASCRMARCRVTAGAIAARWRSQNGVDPSMSVKRKVTVPAGNLAIAYRFSVSQQVGCRLALNAPVRPVRFVITSVEAR